MSPMRPLRSTAAALASVLALSLAVVAPSASASGADEPGADGTSAQEALAAAQAVVSGDVSASRTGGRDPHGRDETLVMRELFTSQDALRGADLRAARAVLARPTTPPDDPDDPRDIYYGPDADLQTRCATTFCLHWVEEGVHAATPGFAATAFDTIATVARTYQRAGFRLPLPDEGQEGDTRTDFYLGDIDSVGALGYCRSDAGAPAVGSAWYVYCGFDNDYASTPWLAPEAALRITVAHEYFHAVQYAYDAEDDGWFYESTATAMEDELADDVNDNVFFLNYGQMGDPAAFGYPAGPATTLDTFDLNAYGNWAFWRHLFGTVPARSAGVPVVLREVLEALDTTRGPNTSYSLQAIERVLARRGTSVADVYADFADANQHPGDAYDEGAEQAYPTAPDTLPARQLSRSRPVAGHRVTLDHLTSATGAVLPWAGSRWLTVGVDVEAPRVMRAMVTVHRVDGTTATTRVRLDGRGRGVAVVPFAASRVASVEVTLTNGSTRMTGCGGGSVQACGGTSPDDGLGAVVGYLAVG